MANFHTSPMSQATEIKKPTVKTALEMISLKNLLQVGLDGIEATTLQNLKTRRSELADYYYNRDPKITYKDKLDIYEELALLHKFFNYKEVKKPYAPNSSKGARAIRTTEDKKTDIAAMHEFCKDFAMTNETPTIEKGTIYAACVRNWTS